MEAKELLRRELKHRRGKLPYPERLAMSEKIEEKLHWLINWQSELVVHSYSAHPSWHEVETARFLEYLQTSCPDVKLHTSRPDKGAATPKEKFDVIIVPLLGFDENCNRLGLGGGWYDRFLAMQPQALTIGLAYECQKVAPRVPIEPHDQPLGAVVTENAIYRN